MVHVSKVLMMNDLINSSNGYQYITELMSQFSGARETQRPRPRPEDLEGQSQQMLSFSCVQYPCCTHQKSEIHLVFCDLNLDKKQIY